MVIRMNDNPVSAMREAVTPALSGLPAGLRKPLAYDNGLENAPHELTNGELGVTSYFGKPCHGWEKRGHRKPQQNIAKIFSQET
jgi:IS30 family transposase